MSSKGIAGFNVGLVRSVAGGYTPTEWATGDVITAEKLNHIEDGIEGANLFLVKNYEDGTYDHTWNEVNNAIRNGIIPVVLKFSDTAQAKDRVALNIIGSVYWTTINETVYYRATDYYDQGDTLESTDPDALLRDV